VPLRLVGSEMCIRDRSKPEEKPAEEKKEEKHGGWTAAMKATIQDHEE
jgi:hypothetical protein